MKNKTYINLLRETKQIVDSAGLSDRQASIAFRQVLRDKLRQEEQEEEFGTGIA